MATQLAHGTPPTKPAARAEKRAKLKAKFRAIKERIGEEEEFRAREEAAREGVCERSLTSHLGAQREMLERWEAKQKGTLL